MEDIELSPTDIRFMHDRINPYFGNGNSVHGTVDNIARGKMSMHDLPKIKVVLKDSLYYAINNRRLYVSRVLHLRGLLDKIIVKQMPITFFKLERFNTKNNGRTVKFYRGRCFLHWKEPAVKDENNATKDLLTDNDDVFGNYDWNDPYDYEDVCQLRQNRLKRLTRRRRKIKIGQIIQSKHSTIRPSPNTINQLFYNNLSDNKDLHDDDEQSDYDDQSN